MEITSNTLEFIARLLLKPLVLVKLINSEEKFIGYLKYYAFYTSKILLSTLASFINLFGFNLTGRNIAFIMIMPVIELYLLAGLVNTSQTQYKQGNIKPSLSQEMQEYFSKQKYQEDFHQELTESVWASMKIC